MGQAITEIGAYSGTISDTTKLPVSDSDTLQAATAAQLKTYMNIPSAVTVDATPTDGSSNAVSSNGVFDALTGKQDASSAFNPATPGPIGATTPSTVNATAVTATGGSIGPLVVEDANTIAQRNGTTAQASYIYNTISGANYERGFLRWASNVLEIGAEKNGTGTLRPVKLISGFGFSATLTSATTIDTPAAGQLRFTCAADSAAYFVIGSGQGSSSTGHTFAGPIHGPYLTALNLQGGGSYSNGQTAGDVNITGGQNWAGGTNSNGGNSNICGGLGSGTGTTGQVNLAYTGSASRGAVKCWGTLTMDAPVLAKSYTTATRPSWVNGAVIFDSDLDKLVIGGVTAWEVVTSV